MGLLQEINRRFLHPLGLALEVVIDNEGNEAFGGLWITDDPEGWCFGPLTEAQKEKAKVLETKLSMGLQVRRKSLGFDIEPID